MSAFGGVSNLQTGSQPGPSDSSLSANYHGSAPLNSSITSDTWLPSTTGADSKLVHGDRWQEITGKMTQYVGGDKNSTYAAGFTETYGGQVTRNMNGAGVEESYNCLVYRTYNAHFEEYFMAGHTQHNELEELEIRTSKTEVIENLCWECGPYKIDMFGIDVGVAGIKTDFATLLQLEIGPVGICTRAVLELGTSPIRLEYGGLTQEAKAMKSKIKAMDLEIAALGVDNEALSVVDMVVGQGFIAP